MLSIVSKALRFITLTDNYYPDYYSMPVNRLKYTSSETVRRVYALARVLAKVFQEAGLKFWTTGGTTLGIVRLGLLCPNTGIPTSSNIPYPVSVLAPYRSYGCPIHFKKILATI
jgi:hypothetical protein